MKLATPVGDTELTFWRESSNC